jgi:hypothetical protein
MVYPINQPMLKYTYTTKDRAIVVQGLVDELKKYVKKNDYLLSTEPMVYYLTDTKPYLYTSWPLEVYEDEGDFNAAIGRALKERSSLPVIVMNKGSEYSYDWPNIIDERGGFEKENALILEAFIITKQYKCVWNNGYFEIMVPPKR